MIFIDRGKVFHLLAYLTAALRDLDGEDVPHGGEIAMVVGTELYGPGENDPEVRTNRRDDWEGRVGTRLSAQQLECARAVLCFFVECGHADAKDVPVYDQ